MNKIVPGTTLKFTEQARESAFSLITPVLEAAGGLTLSQLSGITGLEGSTIQNWVKRGWVPATKGKKYYDRQILRILLINMLRSAMKLDEIVKLMAYVNGDVEDTSDDIIEEQALYDTLCRIIFTAQDEGAFTPETIRPIIDTELERSAESVRSGEEKLKKAMYIMVMAYRSAYIKQLMETELNEILKG